MRLSVTEEVGMVLKMMRSLRKAGGAQIEKKKRFGVMARSTRASRGAKPGLLGPCGKWNGAGVFER